VLVAGDGTLRVARRGRLPIDGLRTFGRLVD